MKKLKAAENRGFRFTFYYVFQLALADRRRFFLSYSPAFSKILGIPRNYLNL